MENHTSLIPRHRSTVTRRINAAAHGSTTIPRPGNVCRAKNKGRFSSPPKNKA